MKKQILLITILLFAKFSFAQNTDSMQIRAVYNEAMSNGKSYKNLEHLCKSIGARLSGSKQSYEALEYVAMLMKEMGADTVLRQPCMVPHWVRGTKEEGIIYRK